MNKQSELAIFTTITVGVIVLIFMLSAIFIVEIQKK